MYKIITDVNSIEKKQWKDFVYEHPDGNIFQTPEFYELHLHQTKYEPVALFVIEQNKIVGLIVATIQKENTGLPGIMSSRAIIWGGPLISQGKENSVGLLLSAYNKSVKSKVLFSQVRNLFNTDKLKKYFIESGFSFKEHLNFLIDLKPDESGLWEKVNSKRRNEIRRAEKEGVIVKELESEKDISDSYDIIRRVYFRVKLPLPELDYFRKINEIFKEKNEGLKYIGAFYENKLIGVMFVLCFKDRIYDWYAGSYKEFYNKYPNDILPWKIFLWSKENNFSIFDFGGAGSPDVEYSVRDYKKKFGGATVNFGRYQLNHKPILMIFAFIGFKLWRFIKY